MDKRFVKEGNLTSYLHSKQKMFRISSYLWAKSNEFATERFRALVALIDFEGKTKHFDMTDERSRSKGTSLTIWTVSKWLFLCGKVKNITIKGRNNLFVPKDGTKRRVYSFTY